MPLHPDRSLDARRRGQARAREEGTLDSRRVAAALIDLWTAAGAGLLAGWIAAQLGSDLTPQGRAWVSLATFLVIDLLAPARPGRRRGQTLGKQLFGLRIARIDGRPLRTWTVLARGLLRWPAWSSALRKLQFGLSGRGYFHERWTGTEVVRDARPATRTTSSAPDR
ncbi:MAG: RDD family protein [Pseudomonas sp.]|nr:RDD family protein [Pseudomonas sp.]